MERCAVLDYPVDVDSVSGLVQVVEEGLSQGKHQHIVTLNPEMLMQGESNPHFARVLKSADVVLPDGAGIVWALRRKKIDAVRVPGIEFSEALLAKAAKEGIPIALLGAQPEVNHAALEALGKRYPGLNIAYTHHGFFQNPDDRVEVAKTCADAAPRYIFVALGVPAQEDWIREFSPLFKTPAVFVGVGGSFDIWSGLKKRAHPLFLKLHLEWLYRITTEPFRLKRVYKTLPMFVIKVLMYDR